MNKFLHRFLLLMLAAVWCMAAALPGTVAEAADQVPCWRLDAPAGNGLPRNIFSTYGWRSLPDEINKTGLEELHISGSGQMAEGEITPLYRYLRSMAGDEPIYLVDLRQESHGFGGGNALSWYSLHNVANRYQNREAVEKIEAEQLQELAEGEVIAMSLGIEDKAAFGPVIIPAVAGTQERPLAEKAGFHYVRIAATDQVGLEPQAVDDFINFYKSLPEKNVWLHFHCQSGHGRTTTFMVMYDIMRHPELSLEDIAARQHALGGSNLLSPAKGNGIYSVWAEERRYMLQRFYDYVQANYQDNFAIPWWQWIRAR